MGAHKIIISYFMETIKTALTEHSYQIHIIATYLGDANHDGWDKLYTITLNLLPGELLLPYEQAFDNAIERSPENRTAMANLVVQLDREIGVCNKNFKLTLGWPISSVSRGLDPMVYFESLLLGDDSLIGNPPGIGKSYTPLMEKLMDNFRDNLPQYWKVQSPAQDIAPTIRTSYKQAIIRYIRDNF